jgi:hypothetical protein
MLLFFKVPQTFMLSWNGLKTLILWIAYSGSLTNELIITNYDHGESIYKFLMYYYDKIHAHQKVPIWCRKIKLKIIKKLHPKNLYKNNIFKSLSTQLKLNLVHKYNP